MTDKIEPALTAEEWESGQVGSLGGTQSVYVRRGEYGTLLVHDKHDDYEAGVPKQLTAAAIAILNDLLPDSDPHKITRQMIDELRDVVQATLCITSDTEGDVRRLRYIDALESYLPPA